MNPQAPKPVHTVQIDPEKLAGLYATVGSNLTRCGLPPGQLNEILAGNISAVCVSCGLKLGGEELGRLALSRDHPDPGNEKFSRLRLGYCGRNGCESRLYDVHFTEHSPIDWKRMLEPVEDSSAPQEAPPAPGAPIPGRSSFSKHALRWGLVLAALGAAIYVTLIYTEGRIPLIQPKHHYTIDPSSAKHPVKQTPP